MNTYSTYTQTDSGPPVSVPPTQDEAYLPHSYYVGIVISELCNLDKTEYEIAISDITERLDHLVSYIHGQLSMQAVVRDYFSSPASLMHVLRSLEDSGLIEIHKDYIVLTGCQLDYIREYLLEYL